MAEIDRDEISRDWAARGFSCELWVDPPGQTWEGFTHPTDEVVIVVEGEMEFEFGGRVVHPALGEEILIRGGTVHDTRNVGRSTARWLYGYKRG